MAQDGQPDYSVILIKKADISINQSGIFTHPN